MERRPRFGVAPSCGVQEECEDEVWALGGLHQPMKVIPSHSCWAAAMVGAEEWVYTEFHEEMAIVFAEERCIYC